MMRSILIGAMAGSAAGMTCPDTPAWVAAGMKITSVASTSCDEIALEIKDRVNGQSTGAWHDPHNNGKYTLGYTSVSQHTYTVSTLRLTGDGKYTDKQIFTLTPVGDWQVGDKCLIEACSRSQVTSIFDMGTNYCDLKMLYCGTADGCKPSFYDFTVGTESTVNFAQASVDLNKCLVTAEEAMQVQHPDEMTCPPTEAWVAAGMKITTVADTSCNIVEAEIKNRVEFQATGAWHDPHNNGKYTLENYGGTVSTSRLTGDGKYTDKQIFTLTPVGGKCKIEACSRSQVTSLLDMGTNYCDLKMLYCGTADGCKPSGYDFTVGTESTEKFAQASVDLKKCLVTAEKTMQIQHPEEMTCPSTEAWPAAGMKITTVANANCNKVEAEIKNRVKGQSTGAWHDPHNNGKYTLENYGGTVSTSRLTGDGKYTDKQIFTLTPLGDILNGYCKIEACSRSQVTSLLDMGTNYCDLKMLYCGTADGCKPSGYDFTVGTESTENFAQASVDLKKCLVTVGETMII